MGEVTFPSDPSCANWFGTCFYKPETDSFLGDTQVDGYLLVKKENYYKREWGCSGGSVLPPDEDWNYGSNL